MTGPDDSNSEPIREATRRLLEARLEAVRQDEVITTYDDLLKAIWDRLESTLGRTTVSVLMQRALSESVDIHPILKDLRADSKGIDLEPLRAALREADADQTLPILRTALREIVIRLTEILTVLTGDIIVRRLLRDLEATR